MKPNMPTHGATKDQVQKSIQRKKKSPMKDSARKSFQEAPYQQRQNYNDSPKAQAPIADICAEDLASYFTEKIDTIRQEISSQPPSAVTPIPPQI